MSPDLEPDIAAKQCSRIRQAAFSLMTGGELRPVFKYNSGMSPRE